MAANTTELEFELWLQVAHGVAGSLLLLSSMCASCLVLLLVSCNQKLRYPSIVISLALVAVDLVVATAWLFQVLAFAIAGEWTLGDELCTGLGAILLWLLYVRWSEVAVVTMDRFLIIIFPFFTYKRYSKPLMIAMTIIAWIVPAASTLPSIFGFGRYVFRPQISVCAVECDGDTPCTRFYTALFGIFLMIGGVIPAFLYTTMYCIGRRKRWKYKNRQLGTVTVDSRSTAATDPQEPTSTSSSSSDNVNEAIVDSPTHLNYDASQQSVSDRTHTPTRRSRRVFRLFKPRDRRAMITIFIIFISMLITHTPIYVFSALRSVREIYESIPLIVHFVGVYIFFLGPILDSVIIMRNKDFRDVLAKALRRHQVRPVNRYNAGRRPSIMLLLNTADRRNSTPGQSNTHSRNDNGSTHNGEAVRHTSTHDGVALQSIVGESPNLQTLSVNKQVSMDSSCYQYVTEV